VYHMVPGREIEAFCTLPSSLVCYGVCIDSTLESSVVVYYSPYNSQYGRMNFVNLSSGDSLHSTYVTIHYVRDTWGDELEYWWQPYQMFCSGSRNGMMAHLYGNYEEVGCWEDIVHYSYWHTYSGRCAIWSAYDFQLQNIGGMYRLHTNAFCLMGSDSLLDWAKSGRYWGTGYGDYGPWEIDWYSTHVVFRNEGWNIFYISEDMSTVIALERADGPATGFFYFEGDSMSYYRRGPTHVWTVASTISGAAFGAGFPRRIVPERVALIYSSHGSIKEMDLLDGRIVESEDFPRHVRAIQPYFAADSSWELMAVFDDKVQGYRVTGLLPAEENSDVVIPETFSLDAYPNPFNSTIKITYEIPKNSNVRLRIMNILGREAATLVNTSQTAGKHDITWNADGFSSGIYFACFEAGHETLVKKLVLLK
ncbi:T9SS type A sorting domain-containing protein, partial [bacterium]|nr:T9SS type A sorting domain-containing protein [bacterium]